MMQPVTANLQVRTRILYPSPTGKDYPLLGL